MNRIYEIIIVTCVILIIASGVQGQQLNKTAQTAMKWLSIPVGAEPIAMGNAYYCVGGGVENIFWNPAGIIDVKSPQLFVNHIAWIADINQDAAAFAMPLGNIGIISASARFVDFGEQDGTRLASNADGWEYTEKFSPSSYQLGLGFTQRITDRFSYGLVISYANENLGTVNYANVLSGDFKNPEAKETSMGLFNVDFGILYYTGYKDLRLGMTLKNFSEEKGYGNVGNPIPMELRFGMAMNILPMFLDSATKHKVTLTWDLSHPRDYSERLHFGLEYMFNEFIALRTGYKTNYDEQDVSFGAGLVSGVGFGSTKIKVDYAMLPFGVFDNVQVFSLAVDF
ncbi:PorV/PorQ family protein [candidate division KSB1 bacterium]|nr:PorV/PorQ family protein [candidate division KSB1 bacterium]